MSKVSRGKLQPASHPTSFSSLVSLKLATWIKGSRVSTVNNRLGFELQQDLEGRVALRTSENNLALVSQPAQTRAALWDLSDPGG